MLIRGGASHAFGFGEHIGLSSADPELEAETKVRETVGY
jgi:hypothetical protein